MLHSRPATNPQDISITCPAQITYQIQPIAEWDPLLYGLKKLPFAEAEVDGRTLRCNYYLNNGLARDFSTLSKEIPAGYICTVQKTVNKNRQFACKRAVAPIKIKPKSD